MTRFLVLSLLSALLGGFPAAHGIVDRPPPRAPSEVEEFVFWHG